MAPLPFTHVAPRLDPLLEHLIAGSEPELKRRRVGQRQAEAAARAARFVDARAARSPTRDAVHPRVTAEPNGGPAASPNGTWADRAATAFPGIGLSPALHARVSAPPTARAQAIERALARGRALAIPEHPPKQRTGQQQQSAIDPDDIPLAMLVAVIVLLELIIGVAVCMFGGGPVVLGFGLVLDGAARVVGTIAAVRSGAEWGAGWRWICGLGGSPGVVAFAFQGNGRFATTDLAPLAGPIAVVALLLILIGLAGIPVGI